MIGNVWKFWGVNSIDYVLCLFEVDQSRKFEIGTSNASFSGNVNWCEVSSKRTGTKVNERLKEMCGACVLKPCVHQVWWKTYTMQVVWSHIKTSDSNRYLGIFRIRIFVWESRAFWCVRILIRWAFPRVGLLHSIKNTQTAAQIKINLFDTIQINSRLRCTCADRRTNDWLNQLRNRV